MYIANVTNDDDNFTDYDNITCTICINTENEDANIIFNFSLLSIPSSIILLTLISLLAHTLIKPLFNNK